MDSRPVVLIYKKRNRDISPLERVCSDLNWSLRVCEGDDELSAEIEKGTALAIVVPLGSTEEGTKNAREFAVTLERILQPEDPDLLILYSTEGLTPTHWPSRGELELDPRLTRIFGDDSGRPQYVSEDSDWKRTIQILGSLKNRLRLERNPKQRTLVIDVSPSVHPSRELIRVPFPTEASVLLRSAFKDMAHIAIAFPRQGFSGSLAFAVTPFDSHGKKRKQFFVKVYPGSEKVFKEVENCLTYAESDLETGCYPPLVHQRRYQGKAYSLFVTELVDGPEDRPMTFRDILQSRRYSAQKVRTYILTALKKMDQGWKSKTAQEPVDLLTAYLGDTLKREDRAGKLESENKFNGWFGNCADSLPLNQKIRNSFSPDLLQGERSKICHGDLHTDNMMVKTFSQPIFIDFSRTGDTHPLKDLVTLESDLIIRGLDGVRELFPREQFALFLKSIPYDSNDRKHKKLTTGIRKQQVKKVLIVLSVLRKNAKSVHDASEAEYLLAALLKTLEVLSYGKLPFDQNERAVMYVTFARDRIKQLSSGT